MKPWLTVLTVRPEDIRVVACTLKSRVAHTISVAVAVIQTAISGKDIVFVAGACTITGSGIIAHSVPTA